MSHSSGLCGLSIDRYGGLETDLAASPVSPLQTGQNSGPPLSPDQIKAPDIALSLTVIEGERYAQISQADYVAHLNGAVSKRIESATKVNNRLVNWIKKRILGLVDCFVLRISWPNFSCRSPDDVQKRATTFRLFVLVAEVSVPSTFFPRLTEF